jgi:hypothetical protein
MEEKKAMATMKAKENEMRQEKAEERQVSIIFYPSYPECELI